MVKQLAQEGQQCRLLHTFQMPNYMRPMLDLQQLQLLWKNNTYESSNTRIKLGILPPVAPKTAPAAEKHATTTAAHPLKKTSQNWYISHLNML